jgi:hypothetical protein
MERWRQRHYLHNLPNGRELASMPANNIREILSGQALTRDMLIELKAEIAAVLTDINATIQAAKEQARDGVWMKRSDFKSLEKERAAYAAKYALLEAEIVRRGQVERRMIARVRPLAQYFVDAARQELEPGVFKHLMDLANDAKSEATQ